MKHTVYLTRASYDTFSFCFYLNNSYLFPRSQLLSEVNDLFLAILLLKKSTHNLKDIASTYSNEFFSIKNFDFVLKLNLQCWNVIND